MMNDYSFEAFGVYLDEKLLEHIADKVSKTEGEVFDKIEAAEFLEIPSQFSFTGSITSLLDEDQSITVDDETIYFLELQKVPSLFVAAYHSPMEAAEELRNKWGKWLPEELDYESNLSHIVGTYYG